MEKTTQKITKEEIIKRYQAGENVTDIVAITGSYSAIYDTLNNANIPLRRLARKPADKKLVEWALPPQLKVVSDPLRLRLDFHNDTVLMHIFNGEVQETRMVSALDVAHTLAGELAYGTGLLPENTLWWQNTTAGPIVAIYEPPGVKRVALSTGRGTEIKRYDLPLPGIILICHAGTPPWVYAVKKRPTKTSDEVYMAPLANVYATGRSCPGSQKYPQRIAEIPQIFWISFFSATSMGERSKSHPNNILDLWDEINGKPDFPMNDLVQHGTVEDLFSMFNHAQSRVELEEGLEPDED